MGTVQRCEDRNPGLEFTEAVLQDFTPQGSRSFHTGPTEEGELHSQGVSRLLGPQSRESLG